jgi:Na+/proline symporter
MRVAGEVDRDTLRGAFGHYEIFAKRNEAGAGGRGAVSADLEARVSWILAAAETASNTIWGLSYIDFGILMGFLVAVLVVGIYASRSVKHESDFYLGGRRMGKAFQFFINFGNATDTNAAPTMARNVYTQGVSGMWLQLQTLFITPFFWFTQPWFRRARVVTMADMFVDRFNSKSVASAYAVFNIMVALLTLGLGNFGGYSVVEAMMVKPESAMTISEKQEVAGFREYQSLLKVDKAARTPEQAERITTLENLSKKNQLRGRIGVLNKWEFYIGYNAIIAIYIMLGGLKAAAITDAVQGVLILVMSVILLPVGLWKIGGFSALHDLVPPDKFWLSGTGTSSYTWYSIIAVTFGSLIQIVGLQHNMAAAGSATNENAARFGMIGGGFTKRVILILWMMCGLLALAIFSGQFQGQPRLSVPEYAWGTLSTYLLPVGLIGLMLSGMLLGHMPAVGLTAVAVSGLVTRNLYEPVVRGMSPKHYLRVGQLVILLVLAASVGIAWEAHSLESLTSNMILFNTFFGAVVLLMFFWRRLTVPAILISFVIWLVIQLVVPTVVGFSALRQSGALTLRTEAYEIPSLRSATADDVAAKRAQRAGDFIKETQAIKPYGVFFDDVALQDPAHPERGYEGVGHFVAENWIMYYPLKAVGLDMRNFSRAGLTTVRWSFCGLFPFLMLMAFSLVTPVSAPERADRFYAKQRTPVGATPEEDRIEVEKSFDNPRRLDHKKLFPGTNWEFGVWERQDYIGFFSCWGVVVVILGFLYLVLHLGA